MMLRAASLDLAALRHGFFTRRGGVSTGVFATLNCSLGSGDDLARVHENRRRALAALGLASDALATCRQVHGTTAVTVERPWAQADRPRADAMVTTCKGVALGILTADCAPILFADERNGIVAAAHAGWRGALAGVVEATVAAMQRDGANVSRIIAAVGPCIGPRSYEVGPEFPAPFLAQDPANAAWFRPAPRPRHHLFDLAGYIRARLKAIGVGQVEATGGDTAGEPERFFSYRRACLAGERQFGHALAAICLAP